MTPLLEKEWLETDGLGGFASGTAAGIRTRRYHALLLAATNPPTGRMVLVNGFDAWVETANGKVAISSQSYTPGVTYPDGSTRIENFEFEPWPKWTFRLDGDVRVEQEIFVPHGAAVVVLRWRLSGARSGAILRVRPFLSGRDYHALHHENPAFRFDAEEADGRLTWHPYDGVPAIVAVSNGRYTPAPDWYRGFRYVQELARGLDFAEDLASPGCFEWNLADDDAVLVFAAGGRTADGREADARRGGESAAACAERLAAAERARRRFPSTLHRAADAYLVRRRTGMTIIAGYPWFTDWGRDTFIALRGLCLAGGRVDEAREILLQWAPHVSLGMLPNRFPDAGDTPEYNAVDASLWFVIAVHEFLAAAKRGKQRLAVADRRVLQSAVGAILDGYVRGTRYGIRCDTDGLLAAGEPGAQLTWMDAKVGDWVVTPRIGKPVEVQALWLNALRAGSAFSEGWAALWQRGVESFGKRFWHDDGGCLFDVVDSGHVAGAVDASFRPNQIFAVGGLPFALLSGERAGRLVDAVEARLLTPVGLRSLAPEEPGYVGRYAGGVRERDGAYHQGTVWPWLLGAFVEAWVRVRGDTVEAKREARARFLAPLLDRLRAAGLGHLPEIADGDSPHAAGGCFFQAWSVGEALRLDRIVLAE